MSTNDPLSILETRRSVPPALLEEPAPRGEELARILAIAARVPDHGMLKPWRFIVIDGAARAEASRRLSEYYAQENTQMEPAKREKFTGIMARMLTAAPLVIVLVSRADAAAKIPLIEQQLSAGAAGMNLLNAIHAAGYGASWLTGWAAYSDNARRVLGLAETERVAGFIHIGAPKEIPADRPRAEISEIVSWWGA